MQQKEIQAELIGQRTLALWEITSIIISCLIAEWVVLSFFGRNRALVAVPVLLALILMLVSHRTYDEDLRKLGFRLDNFLNAMRLLVLPTLAVLAVIIAVAWFMPLCDATAGTSIFIDSVVGAVSAICASGLYQPPSPNRVRPGSKKHSRDSPSVQPGTLPQSSAKRSHIHRGIGVGRSLPAAAKSFRARHFAYHRVDHGGARSSA